jgi:hypothetical protein
MPDANAVANTARAEVARLQAEKFDEVILYLKTRAAADHADYVRAFRDFCASYDRLFLRDPAPVHPTVHPAIFLRIEFSYK